MMRKWTLKKEVDGVDVISGYGILKLDISKCPRHMFIMEWVEHLVEEGILLYNDTEEIE